MIQAAHFDIKSVTGLRQALVLSAEYENEPFPLEGYTLHGSIGTYPRMDLKCSVDENGRARIEWDSVPPGNWKYDVFLISASNDETPLMEGTFTALPRITPVLDDEPVNDEVGGVLHLPSGNEGTITLEVDGGFVSKEYAAIAKDAADKAQQALEDIKQALQGVVTSIGGASGDILLDSGLKITGDREKGNVSLSLDDKTVVLTAGDQTIDGVKTFSSPPVIASAPASNNEAANKKYVDDMASKATGTTINGVSGNITLDLPMQLDPGTKSMSVDLSGYASLQTDNVFEGGNTFMAGIKGHVDSVTGTDILYATNVPGDSSSGHPVLTIEHIGSSNVRISSGTHLMLKARGGNIYAESSFTANNSVNVYGSALFNSGVTASQSLTVGGNIYANGGITPAANMIPGELKTGMNAGSTAVMSVLGNVYHLDLTGSSIITLEGSNVKIARALAGWCALSWVGTSINHKCILVAPEQTNSNYCGAWSPFNLPDYALVMSYLSGVNLVDTSTKFGFTNYNKNISATNIEDIPGTIFYVDCVASKIVIKASNGDTAELPYSGISLYMVSRLDLIIVPASSSSCKIYLARHEGVNANYGNHYNFNRRYLTPQVYYIGEAPIKLGENPISNIILDNNAEQMAMFRISIIQGANPAEFLSINAV